MYIIRSKFQCQKDDKEIIALLDFKAIRTIEATGKEEGKKKTAKKKISHSGDYFAENLNELFAKTLDRCHV